MHIAKEGDWRGKVTLSCTNIHRGNRATAVIPRLGCLHNCPARFIHEEYLVGLRRGLAEIISRLSRQCIHARLFIFLLFHSSDMLLMSRRPTLEISSLGVARLLCLVRNLAFPTLSPLSHCYGVPYQSPGCCCSFHWDLNSRKSQTLTVSLRVLPSRAKKDEPRQLRLSPETVAVIKLALPALALSLSLSHSPPLSFSLTQC